MRFAEHWERDLVNDDVIFGLPGNDRGVKRGVLVLSSPFHKRL